MTAFAAIEKLLHQEIPLAREMGVSVLAASANGAQIVAPLTPNINYSGTGFGGSLYSTAVLSCWLLVQATIKSAELELDTLVIQSGSMDYLHPVDSDFEGQASWPSEETRARFLGGLRRRRLFRTEVSAQIICKNIVCAQLIGRFVAQLRTPPDKDQ